MVAVPGLLGACLLLLALFPIDARAIRVVCATWLVMCTGFGAITIEAAPADASPMDMAFRLLR